MTMYDDAPDTPTHQAKTHRQFTAGGVWVYAEMDSDELYFHAAEKGRGGEWLACDHPVDLREWR